jgi:hypothetical protein
LRSYWRAAHSLMIIVGIDVIGSINRIGPSSRRRIKS